MHSPWTFMTSSDEALYLWKALLISLYCKIQKCGRRILKVFVLVEHIWSLTSTPRFNRATTACPVFPVCVCSYHCGVFPRWKLRTRLFVQYLWLQPMRAICALHVSSLSAEHMYYSYDKCKMHLLTVHLQVVYTTYAYISVQEIPDRNVGAQHMTEFLCFLSL